MIKRQRRIQQIAAVAKEYLAAKSAAGLLREELQADPNYGAKYGWQSRDGEQFHANLNATYLIRLYAEFEAGLRDYWVNCLNRPTNPPMNQLIQLVADQRISLDRLDDADAVRIYRNFLVHDETNEPPAGMQIFTVLEARSHLCYFFGRLNSDW